MSNERFWLAYSALSAYECPEPKEKFSTVSETAVFPRVDWVLRFIIFLSVVQWTWRRIRRLSRFGQRCAANARPDRECAKGDDTAEDEPARERGDLLRRLLRWRASLFHRARIAIELARDLADCPIGKSRLACDGTTRGGRFFKQHVHDTVAIEGVHDGSPIGVATRAGSTGIRMASAWSPKTSRRRSCCRGLGLRRWLSMREIALAVK